MQKQQTHVTEEQASLNPMIMSYFEALNIKHISCLGLLKSCTFPTAAYLCPPLFFDVFVDMRAEPKGLLRIHVPLHP